MAISIAAIASTLSACFGGGDANPAAAGGTTITRDGKPIESSDLTSFSFEYQESSTYPNDDERAAVCQRGRYVATITPAEEGSVQCDLSFSRGEGADPVVTLSFQAEAGVLGDLNDVLVESGITESNGFSATNSARGTYVAIQGDYASGEHLSVYGKGGVSAKPSCDAAVVVVWLNSLAEAQGEHFTRVSSE